MVSNRPVFRLKTDRIEILRDGAAAQYGSDAIAGVINIILKEDNDGASFGVTVGQNFDDSDVNSYRQRATSASVLVNRDSFIYP